jgi:hypothetical protein
VICLGVGARCGPCIVVSFPRSPFSRQRAPTFGRLVPLLSMISTGETGAAIWVGSGTTLPFASRDLGSASQLSRDLI